MDEISMKGHIGSGELGRGTESSFTTTLKFPKAIISAYHL